MKKTYDDNSSGLVAILGLVIAVIMVSVLAYMVGRLDGMAEAAAIARNMGAGQAAMMIDTARNGK